MNKLRRSKDWVAVRARASLAVFSRHRVVRFVRMKFPPRPLPPSLRHPVNLLIQPTTAFDDRRPGIQKGTAERCSSPTNYSSHSYCYCRTEITNFPFSGIASDNRTINRLDMIPRIPSTTLFCWIFFLLDRTNRLLFFAHRFENMKSLDGDYNRR